MDDDSICVMVRSLANVEWVWTKISINNCMQTLGWETSDRTNGRQTYKHAKWPKASVYFDDGVPFRIEIVIQITMDLESLTQLEYEAIVNEYFDRWEILTSKFETVLGKPSFSDGGAASGYPSDQDAVWLSLWNLKSARFMLQEQHEGLDVPIRMTVVLAPVAIG